MRDQRRHRNQLRDEVWASGLCPRHKLVMLAVLHFMDDEGARPGLQQLSIAASMSRTTLSKILQVLVDYDWLAKRKANVPGLSRQPNLYLPPRSNVSPEVPPCCSRGRKQSENLRRGRATNNLPQVGRR